MASLVTYHGRPATLRAVLAWTWNSLCADGRYHLFNEQRLRVELALRFHEPVEFLEPFWNFAFVAVM